MASLADPVVEGPRRPRDITVVSPHNAWTCASCGDTGDLLLTGNAGPLCLDCADLGHLEFLPSGDAALTRRARQASRLSAVVVRWSSRRKRYERHGILAEPVAIEQAAQECLSDADVRARRRTRDQSRRADDDVRFRGEFAAAIREQFPGCPVDRAEAIPKGCVRATTLKALRLSEAVRSDSELCRGGPSRSPGQSGSGG